MIEGDASTRALVERKARWLGPLAIAVAFLVMMVLSWQSWPDQLVDFGRELYVAWQITEGRVLFTDIAYFNGPLSPNVNALWFLLFGESILTLSIANIVITVAIIALLYRILLTVSSHLTASAACLVFVLALGFGQLVRVGNYNYITPYSHEMTHGMLFSLAGIALLTAARGRRRLLFVAGAGLCLGLVFLTKPEFFLAAALAQAIGLAGIIWLDRPGAAKASSIIGAFLVAAVVPILIAFALLATAMPASEALHGILGGWPSVFNHELTELRFYKFSMGMEKPATSIAKLLVGVVCYGLLFGPAMWLAAAVRSDREAAPAIAGAVFLVMSVLLLLFDLPWIDAFRPLPLIMLIAAIIAGVRLLKARGSDDGGAAALARLVMLVFAGALLAKIVLFARLFHYGFALAMPALMMTIVILFHSLPTWLHRRKRSGAIFGAAAAAAVSVLVVDHVGMYMTFFTGKTHIIGAGPDRIRVLPEARASEMSGLLDGLDELLAPSDTLAVLPEGVMINFLTRRPNPTPFVNFMPPEFLIFGEDAMLEAFEATPPDAIVIIPRATSEYGMGDFGYGYGRRLVEWIDDHYGAVAQVGQMQIYLPLDTTQAEAPAPVETP